MTAKMLLVALGSNLRKSVFICIPDSSVESESAGYNSYTDKGPQACKAAIGCVWFGSKCI